MQNKGWTSKMKRDRYPKLYDKTAHLATGSEFYYGENQEKTISSDTKNRNNVLMEMEERSRNGENIPDIAKDIASRPEIQEQFSYFAKNGIKTPLNEMFENWYYSKQKNRKRNDKFIGIGD